MKVKACWDGSGFGRFVAAFSRFFARLWDGSLIRRLLVSDSAGAGECLDGSVFGRFNGWAGQLACSKKGSAPRFGLILGCVGRFLADAPFVPVLFINRSVYNIVGTSFVVRFVAGFFGFDETFCAEYVPEVRNKYYRFVYPILILCVAGLFWFMDFRTFVMVVGAVVGFVLVMYKTEIGVYSAAFLIPIAPTMVVGGVCAVTVLSYFTKIFIVRKGELPFRLNGLDAAALMFVVTLCYSVVISYRVSGSLFLVSIYIVYILFFIAAKNTLRTRRMIFAVVSVMVVSGFFVAAFGVYQRVTGNFIETLSWIDDEMFVQATSRIYSTLENPNVLGEYLIFAIILTFGMLYYQKNPLYKLGTAGILGIAVLCMLFTQSRGAWLGLLCAFALFALIHDRRLVFLGLVALLAAPVFLPDAVIERFLSIGNTGDTSTSYRVNIWIGSVAMIRATWLSGIGPGVDSFRFIYQDFALHAVEAPHSHNLFLQVIIDQGIFGFIVLLLILAIFFKYMFNRYKHVSDPFARTISAALAAGMFGFLVQGLTDNVWYNYRIVAYFWMVLVVCGALKEGKPWGAAPNPANF